MTSEVSQKVTAIIKTFERQECVNDLIDSIKYYYPDLPIIVADDSRNPVPRQDVEYYILPFDSGLSKGRNFLVSKVKTPYVLLLDDDFYFIKETKLEKLLQVLENSDLDIVGGRWIMKTKGRFKIHSYEGKLILEDGVLRHIKESYGKAFGCDLFDIIHNFFLARTDTLRRYTWDEELKVKEHEDFFFNHKGKIKVALHPEVFVYHRKHRAKFYNEFRHREDIFTAKYFAKHGINEYKREGTNWIEPKEVKHLLSKKTIKKFWLKVK